MNKKRVVIALGGNALGKDIEEQKQAVVKTAGVTIDLVQRGMDPIITHGSGPQVGMIQNAMDQLVCSYENYRETLLPICVTTSQGYIGIDLQNTIKYELYKRNVDVKVSTTLSQMEVDSEDEVFKNPTKPIGRFLTEEEARKDMGSGIPCMEDAGRGYHIVMTSPIPMKIRELKIVETLVDVGHIATTRGGSGIPVVNNNGRLSGVSTVIDRDNTSNLLAAELEADYLTILAVVERAATDFDRENQGQLSDLTVDKAREYTTQEQFAKESVLPKIKAAIRFTQSRGGRRILIILLDKAAEGIAGSTGTVIHKQLGDRI